MANQRAFGSVVEVFVKPLTRRNVTAQRDERIDDAFGGRNDRSGSYERSGDEWNSHERHFASDARNPGLAFARNPWFLGRVLER